MLDDVLLIAPSVRQFDDFVQREIPTGRDVEEVSDVIEQNLFTSFDTQVLSQHDESIGLLRPSRSVSDLSDVLTIQTDVFKPFVLDDLGADIL